MKEETILEMFKQQEKTNIEKQEKKQEKTSNIPKNIFNNVPKTINFNFNLNPNDRRSDRMENKSKQDTYSSATKQHPQRKVNSKPSTPIIRKKPPKLPKNYPYKLISSHFKGLELKISPSRKSESETASRPPHPTED